MHTKTIVILFFIFGLLSHSSAQETSCTQNLNTAREAYIIGDFRRVSELLEPCVNGLKNELSNADRTSALELLALTAIATDSADQAKDFIQRLIRVNVNFEQRDPALENMIFRLMLALVKSEMLQSRVSSVSKKDEDASRAPATVELITKADIMNRGYVDVIDLLSDIPGFHISKIYAVTYANIYQMGFRQENTERTLLMVDGVEENDLWLNWAYLSRQYPISGIKAVEVLYGPSSTMYGPRAFVGAINIITYDPKEQTKDPLLIRGDKKSYRSLQVMGNIQAGTLNTKGGDIMLAIRGKEASTRFSMQVTGRYYKSDEHDMSSAEFYDYEPSDVDHFKYDKLNLTKNRFMGKTLDQYMQDYKLPLTSPYYNVMRNPSGAIDSIKLTQQGIDKARELDRAAYTGNVNGAPVGWSNDTEDYYVGVKMKLDQFVIGFRHWKLNEGFGFYQDINEAGSKNGSKWAPINTTMYVKMDKNFNDKLSLSNLSSFAIHKLGKESNRVNFMALGDPSTTLHLAHLMYPEQTFMGTRLPSPTDVIYGTEGQNLTKYSMVKHGWRNRYYYYEAQQMRNETRLFYESKKLSVSSGLDLRSTQTQGDYLMYQDYLTDYESPQAFRDKQKDVAFAQEKGIVENQVSGSNIFSVIDAGIYAQATYNMSEKFSVVAGTRLDYNRIRSSSGYGLVNTPRIVLLYHRDLFTMKVIGSKGLQNVSQWTKYSTGGGRQPNDSLNPEEITYLSMELGGRTSKEMDKDVFNWNMTGFAYEVKNAVASFENGAVKKNVNTGTYMIFGAMASVKVRPVRDIVVQANYTYTNPRQTNSVFDTSFKVSKRIGDIATHMANLSATWVYAGKGPVNLSTNIRGNFVADRKVGPGTTQEKNFGVDGSMMIPGYLIFHGNLGIAAAKFPFARLDFTVQNLLGMNLLDGGSKLYYHSGPREAAGTFNLPDERQGVVYSDKNVPYVPQRGRFLLVKMTFDL